MANVMPPTARPEQPTPMDEDGNSTANSEVATGSTVEPTNNPPTSSPTAMAAPAAATARGTSVQNVYQGVVLPRGIFKHGPRVKRLETVIATMTQQQLKVAWENPECRRTLKSKARALIRSAVQPTNNPPAGAAATTTSSATATAAPAAAATTATSQPKRQREEDSDSSGSPRAQRVKRRRRRSPTPTESELLDSDSSSSDTDSSDDAVPTASGGDDHPTNPCTADTPSDTTALAAQSPTQAAPATRPPHFTLIDSESEDDEDPPVATAKCSKCEEIMDAVRIMHDGRCNECYNAQHVVPASNSICTDKCRKWHRNNNTDDDSSIERHSDSDSDSDSDRGCSSDGDDHASHIRKCGLCGHFGCARPGCVDVNDTVFPGWAPIHLCRGCARAIRRRLPVVARKLMTLPKGGNFPLLFQRLLHTFISNPRANCIIEGPPGTGKSELVKIFMSAIEALTGRRVPHIGKKSTAAILIPALAAAIAHDPVAIVLDDSNLFGPQLQGWVGLLQCLAERTEVDEETVAATYKKIGIKPNGASLTLGRSTRLIIVLNPECAQDRHKASSIGSRFGDVVTFTPTESDMMVLVKILLQTDTAACKRICGYENPETTTPPCPMLELVGRIKSEHFFNHADPNYAGPSFRHLGRQFPNAVGGSCTAATPPDAADLPASKWFGQFGVDTRGRPGRKRWERVRKDLGTGTLVHGKEMDDTTLRKRIRQAAQQLCGAGNAIKRGHRQICAAIRESLTQEPNHPKSFDSLLTPAWLGMFRTTTGIKKPAPTCTKKKMIQNNANNQHL